MDRRRRMLLGVEEEGSQLLALTYVLNDEFTTDESAPVTSPRTTEPGGETLTLLQTDGEYSIVASELNVPAQATPVWGEQYLVGAQQLRAAGLAIHFEHVSTSSGFGWFGFNNDSGPADSTIAGIDAFRLSNGVVRIIEDGTQVNVDPSFATSTPYSFVVIYKGAGSYFFINGGVFSWLLLWPGYAGIGNGYPAFSNHSLVGTLDNLRVSELPAFADSSFITDSLAGALSAGQTFTHEADGWLTFDLDTLPSSGDLILRFRYQDATNYWFLRIRSTGDLALIEFVGGSGTNRGNASAVLAGGEKIRVVFEDETITGYYDNTEAWSYTSATNFKTETAGDIQQLGTGGAASDLETLPRVASGAHLLNLQSIAAGS